MVVMVLSFLMKNKCISLEPIMKMSTFQLNFVYQADLKNLMLLNLEKYLFFEDMWMIFLLITKLTY